MKTSSLIVLAAVLCGGPCLAQTSSQSTSTSKPPTASSPSTANAQSGQQQSIANKIKGDLQSAGFTDVNVVAESFAVTAKSKDGNPVYMTFGPSGMSAVETVGTINNRGNSSSSSGSTNPAPNH